MKKIISLFSFALMTVALTTNAASAATVYTTSLSGSNEIPPSGSAGTGSATVTLDGNNLSVLITFSGLGSPDQMGHIHCCGPIGTNQAVAVPFTNFPLNVTSGSYSNTFNLTSSSVYTAAFITSSGGTVSGAESALIAGLNAGQTYANIHTTAFPAGEIRGQLTATPEPGTMLLAGLALSAVAFARRKSFLKS